MLIDNYDSFTFNVFQYLELEGATVEVFRNDKITLEELIAKEPTQLVISPGPGHPDTDAGISQDVIRYFGGRIPILGVCMGQQCIISAFGGTVDVTGEILHGKTSPLRHDGAGVYQSIAQDIPVTRYHSLAGTHPTLPECLEVSSWIAKGPDGGKGVIMGVRHKEFVVEGVQFHPESILTADGRNMIQNFLLMRGGKWSDQKSSNPTGPEMTNGTSAPHKSPKDNSQSSILDKIFARRRALVDEQKQIPSQRLADLQAAYDLGLAPPQISFPERLRRSPFKLSLMAEIKRASPSKGTISLATCAPAQARQYAQAGASVISVLTEPDWFKGSLDDLRNVRQSLEGQLDRPAVLRKEFIFDEYQILEARLAGADTVLLIVKMLDKETLVRLFEYSRFLGMEPLVEVNNTEEMQIAVDLEAKVIGVNNRNLHTFVVDLETTSRLLGMATSNMIICALSGIAGPEDIAKYQTEGVGAVLIGEALMRSTNVHKFVSTLLGGSSLPSTALEGVPAVKICGTRTPEAARVAIEAGADLIGIILVPGRSRFVPTDIATQIGDVVRSTPKPSPHSLPTDHRIANSDDYFKTAFTMALHPHRSLLVGVFLNATLETILSQVRILQLDVVQLHGSEPLEWTRLIPVPVIRRFAPGEIGLNTRGYHTLPLIDAGAGGSGARVDLSHMEATLATDSQFCFGLAGGLNPANISTVMDDLAEHRQRVLLFDVSSGVETDGQQDLLKIAEFVNVVKSRTRGTHG